MSPAGHAVDVAGVSAGVLMFVQGYCTTTSTGCMQGRVWLAGAGLKSFGVYPMTLEAAPNRNHVTS